MQKLDLLSLMPRSTLKDSIEICFIFFRVLLYFLLILELYTIFGIINENEKMEIRCTVRAAVWPEAIRHWLGLLAKMARQSG
jgi:hypothetical protein